MGDGFDEFDGFDGLDTTIAIVEELSDLDEITNVVALYLANNVVLPESEPFDDIIDLVGQIITEKIKLDAVDKIKEHIDEY